MFTNITNIATINNPSLGHLLLRIVLGIVFIVHGVQKVFGLFGGSGLEKWSSYMATFSIPKPIAILVAVAEVLFGITILLGIFTKVSSIIAFIFMLFAMFMVHTKNGFFVQKNGYEYALVLAIASLSLFFTGGGEYALTKN